MSADLSTLADRLRFARSAVDGLAARELDRLADLHQGHVWAIENGNRETIESDTAIKLCRVLGVSLDWLLTGNGDAPDADVIRDAVEVARSGLVDPATPSQP